MLKSSQELRDEIAEERVKAQAIVNLAETQERELSEEEQSSFDSILDGISSLEASEANALKREELADKLRQETILQARIDQGQIQFGEQELPQNKVIVPARAKSSRKLQAYECEEDAYVAGHAIMAGLFGRKQSIDFLESQGIWNTMTEKVSTAGGFTVPEEMQRSIQRLREERGVFSQYARPYAMASDNLFIPRDINDTTAYWVGEADEITAADVTFGAAELTAKKLACLTKISSELDEDSVVDIGEWVTRSMAYAMADKVDNAGFNGDGTSTYGGVVGLANALDSNAVTDAASGNTGWTTLDLLDFENTLGSLPEYPGSNNRWFMHKSVYVASYVRLMNALGGSIRSEISGDMQPEIMGYPVTFTQVMPSTSAVSTIAAYFGDLSLGATLGTRRGVRTQVSTDRYFENDLIGVKCTERIAITVHEVGDTIRNRPIVALKTAAS